MSRCELLYCIERKHLKRVRFAMGHSRIEAKHLHYTMDSEGARKNMKRSNRRPVTKWTFVKRKQSDLHSIQKPTHVNYELRERKPVKYCASSSTSSCGPIDVENSSSPNNISPQSNKSYSNSDVAIEKSPEDSSLQHIDEHRHTMENSKDENEDEMQEINDKYAAEMERINAEYDAEMRKIKDKYEAEMQRIKDRQSQKEKIAKGLSGNEIMDQAQSKLDQDLN